MEGAGFEPAKAGPADLQSALVDRLSTPPKINVCILTKHRKFSTSFLYQGKQATPLLRKSTEFDFSEHWVTFI